MRRSYVGEGRGESGIGEGGAIKKKERREKGKEGGRLKRGKGERRTWQSNVGEERENGKRMIGIGECGERQERGEEKRRTREGRGGKGEGEGEDWDWRGWGEKTKAG